MILFVSKAVRKKLHQFQYRKRYGLHAILCLEFYPFTWGRFNTASGMDCMQYGLSHAFPIQIYVSIPQAVWIACNSSRSGCRSRRRRVSIPQAVWIACNRVERAQGHRSWRFNTASGMDCMQYAQLTHVSLGVQGVSIPQAVWIACNAKEGFDYGNSYCFNTASGMDCMQYVLVHGNRAFSYQFQYRKRYGLHAINNILVVGLLAFAFQYRKRYGLHAIPKVVYVSKYVRRFQYRKRYGLHAMRRKEGCYEQLG